MTIKIYVFKRFLIEVESFESVFSSPQKKEEIQSFERLDIPQPLRGIAPALHHRVPIQVHLCTILNVVDTFYFFDRQTD